MNALRKLVLAFAALTLGGVAAAETYTVRPGDTMYRIARAHDLEPEELMKLNNLPSTNLEIGQVLEVGGAVKPVPPRQPGSTPEQAAAADAAFYGPAAPLAAAPASAPRLDTPAAPVLEAASSGGMSVRAASSKFLGIPYRLGGNGNGSVDCSSYTQIVFRSMGINIPRTAAAQWRVGSAVSSRGLRPGDLVFFNTTGRGVSHVGIYLGNDQMANANSYYGRSMVEPMMANPYWAKRYVGAKRVI